MKLRVLVADDESLARERIIGLLQAEADIEVVGQCRNGLETVKAIEEHRPDLILLDIKMPGLSGFEVLRSLDPNKLPAVIFVTAYDKHAIEAFDVHALDYLLKPYQPERFKQAIERARQHLRSGADGLTARLLRLLESQNQNEPVLERFSIKAGGRTTFVPVQSVDWIEAAGNYLILHVGKENHLIRETLTSIESRLPLRAFVRVNRSSLVNRQQIKALEPADPEGHRVILHTGAKVPVTRSIRELEELMRFG